MRLLVVRHGHAAPKQGWDGDDTDRPLVSRGRNQAKWLARRLSRHKPIRILSSPSLRCQQTVEPLAGASGVDVELSNQLSRDAGQDALKLVQHLVESEPASSAVVLCTHREVILELLPALSEDFGVKLGHRLPGAKGAVWTLTFRKRKLVSVSYRAAES